MFYCLIVAPFNVFKRKIKVIKKRNYCVIIARKNAFGLINTKKIIKKFGNTFVLEKGVKIDSILPYNTENFVNTQIENYLKSITAKEPILKNLNGEFLPIFLQFLGQKQTVFIRTNNKISFVKLCEDCFDLYGVEPVFFEEKTIENSENFYDIDAFFNKLEEPFFTECEFLKNLDPLQLKAAFFECMNNEK